MVQVRQSILYTPVRSIIPELILGSYLSVQARKPCSISYLLAVRTFNFHNGYSNQHLLQHGLQLLHNALLYERISQPSISQIIVSQSTRLYQTILFGHFPYFIYSLVPVISNY